MSRGEEDFPRRKLMEEITSKMQTDLINIQDGQRHHKSTSLLCSLIFMGLVLACPRSNHNPATAGQLVIAMRHPGLADTRMKQKPSVSQKTSLQENYEVYERRENHKLPGLLTDCFQQQIAHGLLREQEVQRLKSRGKSR